VVEFGYAFDLPNICVSNWLEPVFGPLLAKQPFIAATQHREFNMRSFLILAFAVAAFAATMTVETTSANAVVCAAGVYRAGCAGPKGAAVVVKPPPVAACRYVVVNGVRVRQCA
jgi:hypothetical protein